MRLPLIAAAAMAGIAFVTLPSAASAAPLSGVSKNLAQQTQVTTPDIVQKVQRRGRGRGRGGRVGRRGGRRGGGGNVGAAAAGAAIGIIGGIIAAEAMRHQNAVEWCMRRYRSYNPETGIWFDRHGRPHRCP